MGGVFLKIPAQIYTNYSLSLTITYYYDKIKINNFILCLIYDIFISEPINGKTQKNFHLQKTNLEE